MEEQIIRREVRKADGYEYVYELTVKVSRMVASFTLSLYSVSVSMKSKGEKATYYRINDIFSDLGKATKFFGMLVENLATPIDVPYVLEDSLSIN